ncbi:MAG: hypothetical protein ACLT40_01610 [Fusobacterium sp.]
MKLNNKCGIIYDIDPSKFYAEGLLYFNGVIETNEDNNIFSIISSKMMTMTFDYKINEIINQTINANEMTTAFYRNNEIESFFDSHSDKLIDVIFFADTGIKGIDKTLLEENSIFYIGITDNIKLGFLINKMIALRIFGQNGGNE